MEGTVKWFSQEKGYGFITSDHSGEDHYFNIRSIRGAELPSNGDKVLFESKTGNQGLRAVDVKITLKAIKSRHDKQDDRINCPSCHKKIVPRIVTYYGKPEKSLCPYCGATVKTFSNCFIATSVYGDPHCEAVIELRKFRDTKLKNRAMGRAFIKTYYSVSPPIADWLQSKPTISSFIKKILDWLVTIVRTN
ncbi:hypothetical protein UA32_12290 [Photobacterium angustum]|uniref:Cold shock domain-containing protein n=1 Tax=Photobacterium angustum TaxID=661 RepID=A0ABX5GYN6_PHOAN|nr:hypothetical protein UA32_12290 [Photobacterium angustum]PSX03988.1 cold shock domain-containing protein [Photobacterium angustum]